MHAYICMCVYIYIATISYRGYKTDHNFDDLPNVEAMVGATSCARGEDLIHEPDNLPE